MIGKISYKRRGELTALEWWELKELERKFWDRMVKSKSPSALQAHAKMVEFSAQVFQDAPDLSQFVGPTEEEDIEQHHQVQSNIDQVQGMFSQLQQMLQPVVGIIDGAQHDNKFAVENVLTLEKMLDQSRKKHLDLIAMSEIPELPAGTKSLIDTAKFRVKLDVEDIGTMLHEAKGVMNTPNQDVEWSKSFSMATGNMLTLQQMVYDSKHTLFRREYKLSNLSDHLGADHQSIKTIIASLELAKKDIEVLEYQLLNMKAEINQKYMQADVDV